VTRLSECLSLAIALAASGCIDDGGRDRAAIEWISCDRPGVDETARCATISVPENPSDHGSRIIELSVVVLPAAGPATEADALTFLAGGGVVPATNYAGFLGRALQRVRQTRDIVLVDQRGTGRSNALECDLPDDPPGARAAALERCLDELGQRADPRFYTTPYAMDDLDAVRERLGYDRLTLWGVSYGTKAARVYARRHPGRTRALVLHGTIPIARSMWLDLPASERAFLGRLLDRCAADPECGSAFPRIREEYAALIDRLERKPVTVEESGETIDADRFRRLMYGSLRSTRLAARLPAVIHRAAAGDFSDFAGGPPEGPPPVPRGVYLSIMCSEEAARLDAAQRAEALKSMPSPGAGWFERELADCEAWPAGPLPADYWRPLETDVPVLLLAGEEDFVTPPAYAEAAAERLRNATLLRLPGRGHDDFDPCVGEILQDFVIAGSAQGLDSACLARDAYPPFSVPE
jgi:pimeloyl-ACP methyl ester carboxylesterase